MPVLNLYNNPIIKIPSPVTGTSAFFPFFPYSTAIININPFFDEEDKKFSFRRNKK